MALKVGKMNEKILVAYCIYDDDFYTIFNGVSVCDTITVTNLLVIVNGKVLL